jgi:hypothetical protein
VGGFITVAGAITSGLFAAACGLVIVAVATASAILQR